jgi:hypothetical protein
MNSDELLMILRGEKAVPPSFRMGTIDNGHATGRPKIIFDGEDTPSQKAYPYLGSYTPRAGDRVLLASVSGSYLILGEVK